MVQKNRFDLHTTDENIFFYICCFAEVENKFCPIEKKQISKICIRLPLWVSFRESQFDQAKFIDFRSLFILNVISSAYSCGFTATASDVIQDLNSPKFPSLYGANERCRWHIKAPPGYKVQLTIGFFETESCCDILKVEHSSC